MTATIEGSAYNVTTQYDGNYGRPKSMRYPNDLTIALAYNNQGYLRQESNAQSGYVYRSITAQDVWGKNQQGQINRVRVWCIPTNNIGKS